MHGYLGCADVGALRLRTVVSKDRSYAYHPDETFDGNYNESMAFNLDYTVLMLRWSEGAGRV